MRKIYTIYYYDREHWSDFTKDFIDDTIRKLEIPKNNFETREEAINFILNSDNIDYFSSSYEYFPMETFIKE